MSVFPTVWMNPYATTTAMDSDIQKLKYFSKKLATFLLI